MPTIVDPATGEVLEAQPVCDVTDPADLEAWYGNYGYADHFRKVVLANCREAERAKAVRDSVKHSEARLDDLARGSDAYVNFLIANLDGRRLRERNVIDSTQR
jgi:hypothetical protein